MREGLLSVQLQFQEHGQPLKIDDLTKMASIDEKELGQKVAETEEAISKAVRISSISVAQNQSFLMMLPQKVYWGNSYSVLLFS